MKLPRALFLCALAQEEVASDSARRAGQIKICPKRALAQEEVASGGARCSGQEMDIEGNDWGMEVLESEKRSRIAERN